MSLKPTLLQALFVRRRDAEHTRIERSEAVNKYFDHWGKVTARFESWTTPDYYKQANLEFENSKQVKEHQRRLDARQEKLVKLFESENKNYEQEMQDKERMKKARGNVDIKTLAKIDETLKLKQQIKRKLELESKLYGKWRHGVDDNNIIFQSKSDNEVLAKLNWLDRQINQQLQREKEEEATKELELKLQSELNRSEELQKERQLIREKEIRELRCMQEQHLEQLKDRQRETNELKEREKQLRDNLSNINKELELLEESYSVVSQNIDFCDAYNLKRIKLFTRKRSETFRNQIKLYLSILERNKRFSINCQLLNAFKERLEGQLVNESTRLAQIEGMYESEAKHVLQRSEEIWQFENTKFYKELKQIMIDEYASIRNSINETMQKLEGLLEIRQTHLAVIENCSEKLKCLIHEENSAQPQKSQETKNGEISSRQQMYGNEYTRLNDSNDISLHSPRHCTLGKCSHFEVAKPHHQTDIPSHLRCYESSDSNVSSKHICTNRMSNSFHNLNLNTCETEDDQIPQRDFDTPKRNSQRCFEDFTAATGPGKPQFGRKRVAWN